MGVSTHRRRTCSFVYDFATARNCPPSMQRVKTTVKLSSPSAIRSRLRHLRGTKCVHHSPGGPHAVRVANPKDREFRRPAGLMDISRSISSKAIALPIIKEMTTKAPVLTRRGIRRIVALPASLVNSSDSFVLHIHNRSVVGTNVFSNSCVIIGRRRSTRGKRVIITLVRSSTAIGAFCHRGSQVHLRPRGSAVRPVCTSGPAVLNEIAKLLESL